MAHETNAPAAVQLQLPVLVFGLVEVRRLNRELEALEEFIRQSEIREPGKQAQLPRVSRLLDALATDNGMQLLQPAHRAQLRQLLAVVIKQAPSLHISFAVDPSSAFTSKMVTWLRANIHPWALLEVGLQPTIAAGCIVRTTNKVFDFSLRERFTTARALLIKSLEKAAAEAQELAAASTTATTEAVPTTTVTVATTAPAAPQAVAPLAVPAPTAQPAPAAAQPGAAPVVPQAVVSTPIPAPAPAPEHPALQAVPLPPSPQEAQA